MTVSQAISIILALLSSVLLVAGSMKHAEVKDLCVNIGKVRILENINFSIHDDNPACCSARTAAEKARCSRLSWGSKAIP
jgi:hypothetical protein